MDDILAPLAQIQARLMVTDPAIVARSDVTDQLSRFTELVEALREVTRRLDETDPNILESKAGPAADV
jgi:hypothetical protein